MPDRYAGAISQGRHALCVLSLSLLALTGCGGGGGGGDGGGGGNPPATSPVSRFAYVANFGDDSLSVYLADNGTGQLRHQGYVRTGDGPVAIVPHPSGEFAYSVNYNAQTIRLFNIDWTNGDLVAAACDGGANDCGVGGSPTGLAFDTRGLYAYVLNETTGSLAVFNVNQGSGSLGTAVQNLATGGTGPAALSLHPNGQYLYVTHGNSGVIGIFGISAGDGTLTAAGTATAGGTAITDILLSGDGLHAYIANQGAGTVDSFDIDPSGQLTSTGSIAAGGTVQDLAIDPTDSWLYAVNADASGTISRFAVQSDGTLAAANCSATTTYCAAGGAPQSIRVDVTGQFIAVTNRDNDTLQLFTIDQANGELGNGRTVITRDMPRDLAYMADTSAVGITPRFAYVANETSNDISTFGIDAGTGGLSAVGTPVATGSAPSAVATTPDGRFLYAANNTSNSISAYSVNGSTGVISEISGSPYATTQIGTHSVAVDPSGRFLYSANTSSDSVSAFSINGSSGALTQITGSPFAAGDGPYEMAIGPAGRFAYVVNLNSDDISCYSIDPASGALSQVAGSPFAGGNAPISLVTDPGGRFLYTANASLTGGSYWVSGYRIDSNSGALTELSGSPYDTFTGYGPISIDMDPLGEFVYVANLSSDNIKLFTRDRDTGELTGGATYLTDLDPQSIHVDPSGRFVYTANGGSHNVSGFAINAGNGSLSAISGSPTVSGGSGPISITTVAAFQ